MDALERLADAGDTLLSRVDGTFVRFGAPAEHPVWPLARRLRVLPGEAVRAAVALRPGPAAGPALRRLAQVYGEAANALSTPLAWAGAGADAFTAHRCAVVDHLADGAESLAGRAATAADYAEAVDEWIMRTRDELAWALAEVLRCAQAVTLVTWPGDAGMAGALSVASESADIAYRLLDPLVVAYEEGEELSRRWAPRLGELPMRPVSYTPSPGLLPDLAIDGLDG